MCEDIISYMTHEKSMISFLFSPVNNSCLVVEVNCKMINCLHFIEYHPAGKHLPQVGNNFRQSFQLFIRHKQ